MGPTSINEYKYYVVAVPVTVYAFDGGTPKTMIVETRVFASSEEGAVAQWAECFAKDNDMAFVGVLDAGEKKT